MKAFRTGSPGDAVLAVDDVPTPAPGPHEVLIRVRAAGVTPTELAWYPTTHRQDGSPRIGAIPGHEFSGMVASLGVGAEEFSIGDEVFGMNDWFADGATAEFCVAPVSAVTLKPAHLTHSQAAAVPIGALTAWQGLDRLQLASGERILVHGGAGAVGVFVIQLARLRGAHVITTASARDASFVAELGARQVIDYAGKPFEELVKDVDVIFDCVGGSTLARSWNVLRPGGRLVTIASNSEAAADPRVKAAFFIVEPNRQQLAQIGKMLEHGELRVFVAAEFPLDEAGAAYSRPIERRGVVGKVVIVTSANERTDGGNG